MQEGMDMQTANYIRKNPLNLGVEEHLVLEEALLLFERDMERRERKLPEGAFGHKLIADERKALARLRARL